MIGSQFNTVGTNVDSDRVWKGIIEALDILAREVAAAFRDKSGRPGERRPPKIRLGLLTSRGWVLDFYPGARIKLFVDWQGGWSFVHRPELPGPSGTFTSNRFEKISAPVVRQIWEQRGAVDLTFHQHFTPEALRQRIRLQAGF